MFDSLVITLREGVEAALIVGIVTSYLKKSGREKWIRAVWWGVAAAAVVSVIVAYGVTRWALNEDAYEGWMMLVGAVFVASVVAWMWKAGKHMKQEIEGKLMTLASTPARSAELGVFLFVFLMVGREGAETALFLGAVSFETTALLNFMGAVIGLALAIALGVAFFKGSLRVNLKKFFNVTSLILMVVVVQLLISGLHELSEAMILPSSKREMAIIGPIVNNEAFFFIVMIVLCLFLLAAGRMKSDRPAPADLASMPAPERRKATAQLKRERFWKLSATTVGALIVLLISAQYIYSQVSRAVAPPVRLEVANGVLRIPTDGLKDHKLHHYVVSAAGANVRLIAILDANDSVRLGLDACQICGAKGYYQDGQNVICRNCGAAIYVPTIGQGGGCNPIHVDYVVKHDTIVISAASLAAAAKYFP
jgi:high-affinity iron transporter